MSKRASPTAAEALRLIEQDDGLTEGTRSRMRTGLNAFAKLNRQAMPEMVRLDPQRSLALMERSSPAAFGVKSKATAANYRAAFRAAMRRLGLLAELPKIAAVEDPAWLRLLALLPSDTYDFDRLRAFVSWLAGKGVGPGDVKQLHLDAYAEERQAERGGGKQLDHVRRVLGLWRRAGEDIEGWPRTSLANPKPRQLSLPFDAYPAPLKEQIETYLTDIGTEVDYWVKRPNKAAAEGAATLRTKRPARPVSAATVKMRREGVRRLLWGAVESGVPMESLNSLRVLLDPDVFKPSFTWHMRRKGITDKKVDVQLGTYVGTIFSIANYLDIDLDEKAELKEFFKKVQPDRRKLAKGLIDRHERILQALEDTRTQAMLLHLPKVIMKEARKLRDGHTRKDGTALAPRALEAAWLAGLAVAIEIELHLPLRLKDLTELRIGEHLRLGGAVGSRSIGTLHVEVSSKTGMGVQAPLQPESLRLIHDYLDNYRPLFRHASSDWLFPGEKSADRPRDISAFGTAITENVAQFVGLRVNPHAFRCIAAAFILEDDPHAIDDVRAILGHATFNTALRYYRRMASKEAAARLGRGIARRRRSTSLLGQARSATSKRRPSAKNNWKGIG